MLLDLYRDNHSNFFSFRIKSYVTKAPLTTYVWLLLLIPIPWIWRGSSRINVSIADLVYFPLIVLVLWSWRKSEQKNKIS
jgi:hypothetical protein